MRNKLLITTAAALLAGTSFAWGQAGTGSEGAAGDPGTQRVQQQQGKPGQFTPAQRTQIRELVLKQQTVQRMPKANFSVTVGGTIPQTVKLSPVPAQLVEVQPAWRGYQYVVVEDDIVIVEPSSHRIVAVIE